MIYIANNVLTERGPKSPIPELLLHQERLLCGLDFSNIPYEYKNSIKCFLKFDLLRKFYENIFVIMLSEYSIYKNDKLRAIINIPETIPIMEIFSLPEH